MASNAAHVCAQNVEESIEGDARGVSGWMARRGGVFPSLAARCASKGRNGQFY
jgi:hypothetical protein